MEGEIDIDSVSYGYTGGESGYILEDISFRVEKGEVFCLLGPNGSGKSTLLKCIGGILRPDKGAVFLNGKNIRRMPAKKIARQLGYVPQTLSSAFPFTVRDIVVMGRASHMSMLSSPDEKDMELAYDAMAKTGIRHLAGRHCNMISGGEWQLVLIARALAQSPSILLLDEPTSHLDFGNQVRILEVVASLAEQGMGVIMASHFPDHAFINAGTAGILKDRHLIGIGLPDDVITDTLLKEAYGIDIRVTPIGDPVNRKICVPILERNQA